MANQFCFFLFAHPSASASHTDTPLPACGTLEKYSQAELEQGRNDEDDVGKQESKGKLLSDYQHIGDKEVLVEPGGKQDHVEAFRAETHYEPVLGPGTFFDINHDDETVIGQIRRPSNQVQHSLFLPLLKLFH